MKRYRKVWKKSRMVELVNWFLSVEIEFVMQWYICIV
jgi:hypothetical protein